MVKRKTQPSSRFQRTAIALGLAAFLAGAGIGTDLLLLYPDRPASAAGVEVSLDIPRGAGPNQLAATLHDAGLLGSPGKFALWLRLTSTMTHVRSGELKVQSGLTPRQLVKALAQAGRGLGQRVTIPEGFTLRRIALTVESSGVAPAAEVLALATDPALLSELGIDGPTAEGFAFPDTYYFRRNAGARVVLETLHRNLLKKLAKAGIDPSRINREVLTLASIVQAEAKVLDEMPTIAGVYRNRLTSPLFPSRLLQADPTVAYGCAPLRGKPPTSCSDFGGTLTRRQLDDSTNPYNTYLHPGLPPSPICSPGLDAILASLAPAVVPYFYFVAEGHSGRHVFSTSLAEHNEAVQRYRATK